MTKSMYELKQELLNHNAVYSDFPIGTKVEIVTPMEDMHFFFNETGTVISSENGYLKIKVKFDKPRIFEDGYIQESFNFNPKSLKVIDSIAISDIEYPESLSVL
jgi:hypothetical protein